MAIRMYMGEVVARHGGGLPGSSVGAGSWCDLSGLLAPVEVISELCDNIADKDYQSIEEVEDVLCSINEEYSEYRWNWTYRLILDYFGLDILEETDVNRIMAEADAARNEWLNAIRYDAEREFALGDVSEDEISNFLNNLE